MNAFKQITSFFLTFFISLLVYFIHRTENVLPVLLDGLLQLEPLPNIIENTEYISIKVYCMNLDKNKFVSIDFVEKTKYVQFFEKVYYQLLKSSYSSSNKPFSFDISS